MKLFFAQPDVSFSVILNRYASNNLQDLRYTFQ